MACWFCCSLRSLQSNSLTCSYQVLLHAEKRRSKHTIHNWCKCTNYYKVFWEVALYSFIDNHRHFRGTSCLYFRPWWSMKRILVICWYLFTKLCTSKTVTVTFSTKKTSNFTYNTAQFCKLYKKEKLKNYTTIHHAAEGLTVGSSLVWHNHVGNHLLPKTGLICIVCWTSDLQAIA
jgi:hypothetical protein